MEWQPIETADKLRTILLYSEMWEWTFGATQIGRWDNSGWVFDSGMEILEDEYMPTHWMPLPEPPQ
jgi:hypothetical protein